MKRIIKNSKMYRAISKRVPNAIKASIKSFINYKVLNKKIQLPYMEFHAVDHCNLNCAGCDHFCPLVKDEIFHDPWQLKEDLFRVAKIVSIDRIRIMGGEPLLHPKIELICEFTRSCFPGSHISLLSNGILIPSMKKIFWKKISENNIELQISEYPGVKNIDKIQAIARENYVEPVFAHKADKMRAVINLSPGNKDDHYKLCPASGCINLYRGKLYPCSFVSYVDFFNKEFNLQIPTCPGLDIYNMKQEDVYNLANTPIEMCKYCDSKKKREFLWHKSNKDMHEWTID